MPTTGSYVHTITQPTPIQTFPSYNEIGTEGNWTGLTLAAGVPDGNYAQYDFSDYVTEFYSPVLAGNLTANTFNIGSTAQIDSINCEIGWAYEGGDYLPNSDTGNMLIASVWDGATRYSSLTGATISSITILQNEGVSVASLTFTNNLPGATTVNSTLGVRFQGFFNTIASAGTLCSVLVDYMYVTVNYSFLTGGTGGSTGSTGNTGSTGSTGATGVSGPNNQAIGSYGSPKRFKVVNGKIVDAEEYEATERIYNFII